MATVARPRWDVTRNRKSEEKIGMWLMVTREPAKKNSRNRPAGTMITKSIKSVNVDVYREYLIKKVILEVVEKWPRSHRDVMIKIQQDNAGPHIKEDNPAFIAAVRASGLDITLSFQPHNSPN